MKKIISLISAVMLAVLCIAGVSAETDSAKAVIAVDNASPAVGDVITVTVHLSDITSGEFVTCDAALFYNSKVLQYDAENGVKVSKSLSEKGVSKIYTKAEDSIVRCAVGFGVNALDRIPAEVGSETDVWTVKFTVISEGDTCLRFAEKGKAPVVAGSIDTGIEVYLGDRTKKAELSIEEPEIVTENGESSTIIIEILPVTGPSAAIGSTADDVISQLPDSVDVKLDNGETGKVKVEWTAGSVVSGFDGNTPGEYYFTGKVVDSSGYDNYNELYTTVKVEIGDEEKTGESGNENVAGPENDEEKAYTFEIIMVIGSDKPSVNGEIVPIDVPAMILDSRTMTPARFVAESLGAEVLWDDATRTVTIKDENHEIILVIDSKIAVIDGVETEIDVPATIIDDRTLTPSRLVAEALGAEVLWDDATKTVTIRK